MPSREEISELLRDRANQLFWKSKRLENDFGQKDACIKRAQWWHDIASQVEQMCCRNCKYYITQIHGEWTDGCNLGGLTVEGQGPDFGCWHFEQKVK